MSILIIDDSQESRLLLKSILKAAGYTDVLTAGSAHEAFKILNLDGETKAPTPIDLILMDIMMPEIDGIEACKRIKAREHLRDIPIIMITALTDVEILKTAFAAGAMDYIAKPPNKVELLARVRSALRLKHEMDARKAREQELLEVTRQLEEANQILLRLSSLDGLTGIANRRRFDEFLDVEWRRGLRESAPLSLIMLDIDFFKAYNDAYGHQAGDDCLKVVANTLSNTVNRPGDLVARYGGEEFAVILPRTHPEGAVTVAELLRAKVEALKIPHSRSRVSDVVTISLGVSTVVPRPGYSTAALIAAADQALYQAKQEGRNRVRVRYPAPFPDYTLPESGKITP